MTPTPRLKDLARGNEILYVFARHGFGEFVGKLPLQRIPGLRRVQARATEEGKLTAPVRLTRAFAALGPTFIKLGQLLSTRADLLSPDYLDALATLHENVPCVPFEDLKTVVEEEFDREVDKVFASIDPEPIAAASIAQVYKARTHDGLDVAVKIQRPGIEEVIRSDMSIMYVLAVLAEETLDFPGARTLPAIVRQFEQAMHQELDFGNEATNAELFTKQMISVKNVCGVTPIHALSTRRVLTMHWIDTVPLTQFADLGLEGRSIMDTLVESTFSQVFRTGFFHADPHPGNLRLAKDGCIIYLDFGLMGRLGRAAQDNLAGLFTALILRDSRSMAQQLYRIGAAEGRVELREFAREVELLFDRYHGVTLEEIPTDKLASDLLRLANRHTLHMPEEYAVLARAAATLDGIAQSICPEWNAAKATEPYVQELLAVHGDPSKVGMELMKLAVSGAQTLRDLPMQLDQLLLDLERGQLKIIVEQPNLRRLEDEVRTAADSVVLGLGSTAFLIAAAVLWLVVPPIPDPLIHAAVTWSALVICLIVGFSMGWAIVARRALPPIVRRLRLFRWFRRAR